MNWFPGPPKKKTKLVVESTYQLEKEALEKQQIQEKVDSFLTEQAKLPRVKLVANLENGSVVESSDFEPIAHSYPHWLVTKKEVASSKRHNFFKDHYFLTKDDIAIPMVRVKDIRIIEY